jgi:hypothetical protein
MPVRVNEGDVPVELSGYQSIRLLATDSIEFVMWSPIRGDHVS